MGKSIAVGILIIGAIALVVLRLAAYTVDEVNFAMVLQFGDIRQVRTGPGLYFKVPLVQEVTYLDKRILTSDTPPEEYLTSDQKRIVVDQVTRWKIKEPRLFFLAHTTESGGRAKLERLVLGALREKIAERAYDIMISGERDDIMDLAKQSVQVQVDQERWGIELIDVRTKRADLPGAVEQTVYARMASARKVEADRHRAQGQLLSDQITAQTNREVLIMLACADRVAKETRGKGEAAAIAIFAEALQQDPEFYSFIRRLEAYDVSFGSQDRLIMGTDSNFFRLLSGEVVPIPAIQSTQGKVVPLSEEIIAPLTQEEIDALIEECTPETIEDVAPGS
jgi:membrane protease subunit HflC